MKIIIQILFIILFSVDLFAQSDDRDYDEELRYPDEFVRHKILDICGDLMLADYRIIGKFTSICGGHHINYLALKELFENKK